VKSWSFLWRYDIFAMQTVPRNKCSITIIAQNPEL
jgi:hypothetical protein